MPDPQRSKAKSGQAGPAGKQRELSREISWESSVHHRTQSFEIQMQKERNGSESPSQYFTNKEPSTRPLLENNGAGSMLIDPLPLKATPSKRVTRHVTTGRKDAYGARSPTKFKTARVSSKMLLPRCMFEIKPERLKVLRHASRLPPVTEKSLSELDLESIQNNLNLRIDICYDHDLYFQPISGRKGDLKRIDSEEYWTSLAIELQIYQHNSQQSCRQCESSNLRRERDLTFEPRLKVMFDELSKLLKILVPVTDRDEVTDQLDIKLIMQQVEVWQLDIIRLSSWLFKLLTTHCAPMRDELAEDMNSHLSRGAETNNAETLAEGLEKLFAFLEAMKLDVANHQIRTFRWPLIEDTIPFQIDCFQNMRDSGRLDLRGARKWFEAALREARKDSRAISSPYETFISAITGLCDPAQNLLPITFHYDKQRFARLQEDVLDLVQLQTCFVLIDFVLERLSIQHNRAVTHAKLAERIMQVVDDDDSEGNSIADNIDAIGIEIARFISKKAGVAPPQTTSNNSDLNVDFDDITNMLRRALMREQDDKRVTRHFLTALSERTRQAARKFFSMNTLEISNSQRRWAQNRQVDGQISIVPSLDDMARRLAHLGVVHWKVWSELVYLNDRVAIFDKDSESDADGDDSEMEDLPTGVLSIEVEQMAQSFD